MIALIRAAYTSVLATVALGVAYIALVPSAPPSPAPHSISPQQKKAEISIDSASSNEVAAHHSTLHDSDCDLDASPISRDSSNYTVTAIFHDNASKSSSAAINLANIGTLRFKEGDTILAMGRVKKIGVREVIIFSSGCLLTARLDSLDAPHLEPLEPPSVNLQTSQHETPRETLIKMHDLTPVQSDAPSGYVIGSRFYPKILKEWGAEPGDIIISVNGYLLGETTNDLLALESYKEMGRAEIRILSKHGETLYRQYP
ncbi:hypothetical protein [Isoalcanivorax beigongshangi]|uniref:Type II secretion system protein GspC N-terminal domain-containing protein n=1 Tax=Isoalcanivorax beigongshangi TaxID=3238810 RepID=A0ABV4AE80_9GAMM